MPSWLLHDYWPWWLGGAFFGAIVVGMWLLERRLLGVSGSYAAAVERTREEDDAAKRLDEADAGGLDEAMLRATLEAFGPEAVEAFQKEMAAEETSKADEASIAVPRSFLPRSVHITFLSMLAVGGALGGIAQGSWRIHLDLGVMHDALTGGGATSLLVLVFGGVLVGFGTRMAGGCSSGHGLSGCSRLVPASLAATASFFGSAIAVSFLLEALAR